MVGGRLVAGWWPTLADGNIRVASGHNTGISSSVTPDRGETSASAVDSRLDIDVHPYSQSFKTQLKTKIGMLL